MKTKFFPLLFALMASIGTMSANTLTLAYELNGGVSNDYGWKTKGEILLDFQKDLNEALGKSFAWAKMEDGIVYYNMNGTWKKETEVTGEFCNITGFIQNTTYNTSDWLKTFINTTRPEKYGWLKDVMVAARKKAGLGVTDDDLNEGVYRKEISAFFLNSPADGSWPASASYETQGLIEHFMPIWEHGLANPTEVTAGFVLNAPYKAGFTFDGWYANQEFSGEKVHSVNPESNIPGNKLYAKWIEYIPTIAEIIAMEENTETHAKGVVTYINSKNVFIQDASAGMLLYCKAAPTFKVGDLVLVKGTRTVYGGAPELKDVEEVRAEAGTMPKAIPIATLAEFKANALKYFGQLVAFKGLTIIALDNYKNPSLSDGVDTIACFKMVVDDNLFPVGTRVNVTAIAGYYNGPQFLGDPAGITHVPCAVQENYAYPAYGNGGEYTLTNKWIISNIRDNFTTNTPSPADHARGMVAKDGKMYFINRAVGGFTVVDGATGKMANDPILITGDHLFQAQDSTFNDAKEFTGMEWKPCVTLAYNDVKLDQAGHFLIGACVSGGQRFQIYKVDIATGAATEVVNDRLYDYADWNLAAEATTWRFDAFNVYGDVDSKAIIMAADANSFYVYYWEIENGVAGEAQRVNCTPDPSMDQSLLIKENGTLSVSAFGTAPQVFPIDYEYFYVDGWNTLPMLFDMEGSIVQDFISVPTGVNVKMGEEECTMNVGHNGLCEFQVGSEYYLLMAATNTVGSPTSAFALYKYANEDREFSEMTPMWYFPHEGMGSATNVCRTTATSVEVNGNKATIYVYTNNNGYGVYEMTAPSISVVTFVDWDGAVLKTEQIYKGDAATAPDTPTRYGYIFTGWDKDFSNVTSDMTVIAQYTPAKFTFTATCDTTYGYAIAENGEHDYLTEISISVTEKYGYHFTQWSDGNTNNPRTIVLTKDTSLVAQFAKNTYAISLQPDLAEHGSVSGAGTFEYLDNKQIAAQANYGYHFVKWSDGVTDNPRAIELTQDITLTAEFAKNTYTISTTSANPEWGTTAGGKSALYLDEVEISATPNYGYHFVQWSDYNTEPTRTIVVERDSVITATFAKNVYSITKNAEHGTISGNSSAEYLDYVTLTATPDYGYHFTQWSDGLKDNPRIFRLTQDTTFTAEFAYDRVGQCGKDLALVWSYDPTNKVLTIGNAGEFTENMQFGAEAPTEMEELVIGNNVTAIGENAFAGISTLKKVSIGESVKTIHNNAFYNCVNLETIFNYRPTPTNAYSTAFDGVDKFECKLYVLPNSIDMYKNASVWRDFYYTYAIGAEETTVTTNDVKVEPQDNAATVTWPTSENAASYTIQITKDGVVFCTLIFNANGQLTGIAFAPGRDGQSMAPAAVMTANGLQFTVTGLTSNTHYGYSLTAKDANEQPIATYSGSFTTTSEGIATGVDNTAVESEITKILRNGEVLILRGGKTYTVQGQEVR